MCFSRHRKTKLHHTLREDSRGRSDVVINKEATDRHEEKQGQSDEGLD